METPTLFAPYQAAPETTCIPSYFPLPGLGMLVVNAFVIAGAEPVLVDTGLSALRDEFLAALRQVIDPADIRWIWLSHMDADHIGNLQGILDLAPAAKVVTNFLGMGKMILQHLDVSRVHMLEPGTALDLGDRIIASLKPPYYDAPETVGFFDTRTRVLFSADAFGALMQAPQQDAAAIAPQALFDGLAEWTAIDAPWLGLVDRGAFGGVLADIERLDPAAIISGHLPAAQGMTDTLLRQLERVLAAGKIATTDRAAIERLLSMPAAA
jgi:glyoxylase-like metal-dependent hydrolase (beta-lactamase superfamily II)